MVVKAAASPILELIRRSLEDARVRELPDQDVLQRFHDQQDQAAFHALLRRHGPMVLDVCQSALGNEADAEDAFQATFLILARKAGSIRKTAALASWLHGVAYRTALKARAQSAARHKHEARAPARQPAELDDVSWREVRQTVHEEVNRLPERYRAPLVLCYLEGATQESAAVRLKLAKSTLRERLERGRALLRTRLVRRGLGPAAVLVTAAWPAVNASAYVPLSVVSTTIKAASLFAAGQTAAVGLISAKATALAGGVLKTMLLSKLKVAVAVLLAIGALGIGASALPYRTVAAEPPSPESKSAAFAQDQVNLKETVLALEKRAWEALTKQDTDAVRALLADDFTGSDTRGEIESKARSLAWMASFRVVDPEMKKVKVVVLNATSAIVTYEIRYKIASTEGQIVQTVAPRHVTSVWTMRNGKWRWAYCDTSLQGSDGSRSKAASADERWKTADTWQIMPVQFKNNLALSDTKLEVVTDKDEARVKKLRIRLPPPADTAPALGNVAEPLSVQLARINSPNATYTIAEAIPIVKQYIELDMKRLKEAKDVKSMRQAVDGLEKSVQMLKELLSFEMPAEKKP